MDRRDVVVVGAGITGLSAAWALHRAGRSVLLVEAEDRVGGVIRSERVPGLGVLDLGPQTVRTCDPDLFDHLEELGIADERIVAGEAGSSRYVVLDGELVELPHSPGSFLRSPLLSTGAKLRLLTEPFRGTRPGEDESVRQFFGRRLGPQVAERLVDPFVSGVYAGDPERLSMAAVFPDLKSGVDQAGSLLQWGIGRMRAARAGRDPNAPPKRPAELFSFPDGLARWPRAIAEELGEDRVLVGHRTVSADRVDDGWHLRLEGRDGPRTVACRVVVLAVPAVRVHEILGTAGSSGVVERDPDQGATTDGPRPTGEGAGTDRGPTTDEGLAAIPYSPVSTVHLAYHRDAIEHPLDGFGYLCPSREERRVLGVLWISSLFPARVEGDRVLLTTFVGGARQPDRAFEPEEKLIEIAYGEHRRFLGASRSPVYSRVQRWERAIPQYEFGHADRVAEADRLEADHPGLLLAGAWRDGVSVIDCWKGGRRAAKEALELATR